MKQLSKKSHSSEKPKVGTVQARKTCFFLTGNIKRPKRGTTEKSKVAVPRNLNQKRDTIWARKRLKNQTNEQFEPTNSCFPTLELFKVCTKIGPFKHICYNLTESHCRSRVHFLRKAPTKNLFFNNVV